MNFTPSSYQSAIFDWLQDGEGSGVLTAVAGSGKTSTIIEGVNFIPRFSSVGFLAFNKSIATELKSRLPRNVSAMTLNGLGWRAWTNSQGNCTLNSKKTQGVMQHVLTLREISTVGFPVRKLVDLAKQVGLVPRKFAIAKGLVEDTENVWHDLIDYHDIDFAELNVDKLKLKKEHCISLARQVLKHSILAKDELDFSDQLYMPVVYGIKIPTFEHLFVDEAQDVSHIQRILCSRALAPGGRLIAVGDKKQAIYCWRGAAADSIDRFVSEFASRVLPLSICYRCPKSHVRMAQEIVPEIEAHENAIEGEIRHFGHTYKSQDFRPEDLIICRYNAPIVKLAYRLIGEKVRVRVLGRDIGTGLVTLIERLNAHSVDELLKKLEVWREAEVAWLIEREGHDANLDRVVDKFETIKVFADAHPRSSVRQLTQDIESMFSEQESGGVTLSTIHRAKGLEADSVFVLNNSSMPSKWVKKPWAREQEQNLRYIAYTRAKKTLSFID